MKQKDETQMRGSMWDFEKYADKIAFVTEQGNCLTYKEVDVICQQCGLLMAGERQLAFLVCDNSMDSILIYLSCIQNQIPVLLFDEVLGRETLYSLLTVYQPKWILHRGIWNMPEEYDLAGKFCSFFLMEQKKYRIDIYSELALLLLTSGSTGSRKTVRLSYENIASNMRAIVTALRITNNDRAMFMLPQSYSYGLSVLHSHLAAGASILVPTAKFYQKSFWDFFLRERGTSICGVPYMYHVLKKLKFMEKVYPSLRLITQAGGELEVREQEYVLYFAEKQGADFAVMYGQTEATARISCFYLNEHPEKIGSVGCVLNEGRLWIEKPEEDILGEIIYQGSNVMLGYAQGKSDLKEGQVTNGILYTGDLGYLDEEGYLYIRGRKNRIAKVHGMRINLDEIQKILTVSAGEEVYCIEGRECLCICCVSQSLVEKLKDSFTILSLDKRLCRVCIIENIPRNENGKVNYKRLQELVY